MNANSSNLVRRAFAPLFIATLALFVLAACGATPNEDGSAGSSDSSKESTAEPASTSSTIDALVERMTLEQKICQLLIVDPETLTGFGLVTQTGDATKAALDKYPVGGIIYFTQNLQTVDQAQEMLEGINDHEQKTGGIPLFLAIDEEGGVVARCADALGTTTFLPMYEYREQGTNVARSNARTIAEDLAGVGFNLDFAPVADTLSNPENEIIGTRAYSDDFDEAAELVAAAVEGFHEGGVACSVKHFPGHGNTLADSHLGAVYSDDDLENLRAEELVPFAAGIDAGADMVMVGHITMTAIDPDVPATLSPAVVTDLLRNEMGYDGVVITDAMNMGAMADKYAAGESSVMALQAGVDLVLMPTSIDETIEAVEQAISRGSLTEERIDQSVRRVLALKADRGLLGV